MKKIQHYINSVTIGNKTINCMVKVDLENKARVFCSFYPAGGKKLMPDYFKIVLPAKIVEGVEFEGLNHKNITYKEEKGMREGLRTLADGQRHEQPNLVTKELNITPAQLVERLKIIVKENHFEKERQDAFILSKRPHWDFTNLQVK
jgi:hypothetical protein